MCRTYAFTFCARFSKVLIVVSLHDPAVDLLQNFNEIKIILNRLELLREQAESDFHKIFMKALADEPINIFQRTGRQTQRENYPTNESEAYFRQCTFHILMD